MTTRSDALLEAVAQAWVDRGGDEEDFRLLRDELGKRISARCDALADGDAVAARDEAMIDELIERAR